MAASPPTGSPGIRIKPAAGEQCARVRFKAVTGAGFGWGQVEDPVAEPADGVGDVGRDGGQVVGVAGAGAACVRPVHGFSPGKVQFVTLIVTSKGPEGLALAADSRATITVTMDSGRRNVLYLDTATKLFSLTGQPYVGLLAWGEYFFGNGRSISGCIPELEARIAGRSDGRRLTVAEVAGEVSSFFTEQWRTHAQPAGNGPMWFQVAGFDEGDTQGKRYQVGIPDRPAPKQFADNVPISWGGQSELVARLMNGVDPAAAEIVKNELTLTDNQVSSVKDRWHNELALTVRPDGLPLQSCVDLVVYLVTMTIAGLSFTYGRVQGVGGPVDVATITQANGFQWVSRKQIEARPPFAIPDPGDGPAPPPASRS